MRLPPRHVQPKDLRILMSLWWEGGGRRGEKQPTGFFEQPPLFLLFYSHAYVTRPRLNDLYPVSKLVSSPHSFLPLATCNETIFPIFFFFLPRELNWIDLAFSFIYATLYMCIYIYRERERRTFATLEGRRKLKKVTR